MANRPRNERQDLLESMYEPDGILLTTDDVVLRRGTHEELSSFLMENGGHELCGILRDIPWLPESERERLTGDALRRLVDTLPKGVVEVPGHGIVGIYTVEYHDDFLPPRVGLSIPSPFASEDRGRILDLLTDTLHRLNGDDEFEISCLPHAFPDRAMLESRGAWIHRFEQTSPLSPGDREVYAATWEASSDAELQGIASGFGVSKVDLFCGSLVYRLSWGAPRQDVVDDRPDTCGAGLDQVIWFVRDLVLRVKTIDDLFSSGHPLRALRVAREAIAALRSSSRGGNRPDRRVVAEAEREIDRFERDLRDRGEGE